MPVGMHGEGELPDDPYNPDEPTFPCPNCGRKMRNNALQLHLKRRLCQRPARKEMDMKKKRLGGDLAREAQKLRDPSKEMEVQRKAQAKKDKWRMDAMQLKEAMKAGKEVSKAIKEGLPLPPPTKSSAPDDRVQCPHCARKFNDMAAQRHIPKCAESKRRAPGGAQRGMPPNVAPPVVGSKRR